MSDPGPERFKWAMLHVAVDDPPWNLGMAWADAIDAFPDREAGEVDGIVRGSLLDLLDAGYVFFFRFMEFDDEFRDRSPAECLSHEEVAAALVASGRQPAGGAEVAVAELLAFRATEEGKRRHAELADDEYRIFGRDSL